MAISITDPIVRAVERTKLILFQPFEIGKWFSLGFCAFLSTCGRGGNINCNNVQIPTPSSPSHSPPPSPPSSPPPPSFPSSPTTPGSGPGSFPATQPTSPWGGQPTYPIQPSPSPSYVDPFEQFEQWLQNLDWTMIALIIGALVILGLAIGLLVLWLGSRGEFMFLDGVVHNRGSVVEPWKKYRELGNSLFFFRVLLGVVLLVTLGLIVGLGVVIAWPDIQAQELRANGWTAIAVAGTFGLLWWLAALMAQVWLHGFVVPIMYMGDLKTMPAYGLFFREILSGHVGSFVLFHLMQLLLVFAIGMIACMAMCLTCFLVAIPYLGTVILLPLTVFQRCYPLYFLQQFGSQWQIFLSENVCPSCGYDLRGSVGRSECPECGTRIVHKADPGPPEMGPSPG